MNLGPAVRRHDLVALLRGAKRHMGRLLELDPWLPMPQCGCTFSFGEHDAPLPIGALHRVLVQLPELEGRCNACHGPLMPFVFGGLARGGGVKSCCLACARAHYRPIGGARAVAAFVGPALAGTPFAINAIHDNKAIFGDRRPLWRALRSLGVVDLPDEAWTESREALEPWPVVRLRGQAAAADDGPGSGDAPARGRGPYAPVRPLPAMEKVELTGDNELVYGDRSKFPYLVIRAIPGIYINEPIHVGTEPPASRRPDAIVVVHPDPWVDGRLRPEVEQELIDQVHERCKSTRLKMVIVFAADRQLYLEPDGKTYWTTDGIPRTFLGPSNLSKLN